MNANETDAATLTGGSSPVAGESGPAPSGSWGAAGRLLVTLLPIGGLLLLWEMVVYVGWFKPTLLSPPSVAFPEVWTYFASGAILPHLGASLQRGALGFSIAALVGVPLGLFIGSVRLVSLAASPIIEFLRQLPPLAMLPVFLLFLGLGFRAQVAIVIWAAIWPILLNTITGARGIDERLKKAARTLGAGRRDIFLKVALPSALPTIMTGVRLGASYAFLVLVAAEMVGADSGLGFLILNNQYTFKIPQMYAAILILALLGVILNYGLIALERHLTPWRGHA
jgi:ABC-type nitrate/sulfonate/bicarbonate transport system permease component